MTHSFQPPGYYSRCTLLPDTACAFTGHRPAKLPWRYDESAPGCVALTAALEQQIATLAETGITDFISGMALGTDMICARIVLALKSKNPAIKLHCALPCQSQADQWTAESRQQYQSILSAADAVDLVSRDNTPDSMMKRNRFMVDHASILLAVYNGEKRGGTAMTIRYARKQGRELYILNPVTLEIVHENADGGKAGKEKVQ